MLWKMTEEPDDFEGPWPKENAVKPTIDEVMRMIRDNEFMRSDEARCRIRTALESLAATVVPVVQEQAKGERAAEAREFVRLTDEELDAVLRFHTWPSRDLARAIEAAVIAKQRGSQYWRLPPAHRSHALFRRQQAGR